MLDRVPLVLIGALLVCARANANICRDSWTAQGMDSFLQDGSLSADVVKLGQAEDTDMAVFDSLHHF